MGPGLAAPARTWPLRLAALAVGLIALATAVAAQERVGTPADSGASTSSPLAHGTSVHEAFDTAFPQYFWYTYMGGPDVDSLSAAAKRLRADEVLLFYVLSEFENSFVFAITKTGVHWQEIDANRAEIEQSIQLLRCGLDELAWKQNDLCEQSFGKAPEPPAPFPFSLELAHKLYVQLLGGLEHVFTGRRLLIVADRALVSLPFQALITKAPSQSGSPADFRAQSWLTRNNPIVIVPSISSLVALRSRRQQTTGAKAYLGIGNPLLSGDGTPWQATLAVAARAATTCQRAPRAEATRLRGNPATTTKPAFRGRVADVAEVALMSPLPETRDEVCDIAATLGAGEDDLLLAARASERSLKELSIRGDLPKYRVLHFATHGVLAGDMRGVEQPALVLTPPTEGTELDDGLLTASEIAQLRMDADLVILSACNTGFVGGSTKQDSVSGLSRAFFFAGARTLMVSQWPVNSEAAVLLTSRAIREGKFGSARIDADEALRRSMLSVIDSGTAHQGHPMIWAPFFIIGG